MISRFCRTDSLIIPFSGEQTVDSLVCVHDLLIAGVNIQVVCQHEVAVAADPLNCLGIDTSLVKHTKVAVPEDVWHGSVEVYRFLDILEHSREDHLRQRLFATEKEIGKHLIFPIHIALFPSFAPRKIRDCPRLLRRASAAPLKASPFIHLKGVGFPESVSQAPFRTGPEGFRRSEQSRLEPILRLECRAM